jgi:hypothetical protein
MSEKLTNEKRTNSNIEESKPKAVHLSPYSSFYGESTATSTTTNQPFTQYPQQNQSKNF